MYVCMCVPKRFKFICPDKNKNCPHRKSHYGCTKYLQIKDKIPGKIYPYEKAFKKIYYKRMGIERYNAVLQRLGEETPNHFIREAIENTIMFAILGTALITAFNAKKKQ